jgi:hypothetical protein
MQVNDCFRRLGERIDRDWHRVSYRDDDFSRIAFDALTDLEPHRRIRGKDVVRWALSERHLPSQFDLEAAFGEPPVTTYNGHGFFICVQFWLTSSTAIHDHGFSGAFQVLDGGSLETLFRFTASKWVNRHMALGKLEEVESRVLEPGATSEIRTDMIHSLFHLEHPSATIVVRRRTDPGTWPQLTYHRPGLALDPFHFPADLQRRLQVLRMVGRSNTKELSRDCLRFLAHADLFSQVEALKLCSGLLSPEENDALLERVRRRWPGIARLADGIVEQERRQAFLRRRRTNVLDPDLRFFLAVLLNVRGRARALDIVRRRYPRRDPVLTILDWVRALAALPGPKHDDVSALGFPLDETVLALLEELLRGRGTGDASRRIAALAGRALSAREKKDVQRLGVALTRSEIFQTMLES